MREIQRKNPRLDAPEQAALDHAGESVMKWAMEAREPTAGNASVMAGPPFRRGSLIVRDTMKPPSGTHGRIGRDDPCQTSRSAWV
jgi:hypothetical protein